MTPAHIHVDMTAASRFRSRDARRVRARVRELHDTQRLCSDRLDSTARHLSDSRSRIVGRGPTVLTIPAAAVATLPTLKNEMRGGHAAAPKNDHRASHIEPLNCSMLNSVARSPRAALSGSTFCTLERQRRW